MEISIPESQHFRNLVSIIFAMVVGVIVVGTIESLGHTIVPPPADLDMSDADQMKEYLANAPVLAMLFVIAGWAAGMFSGCLFAGIMGISKGTFCCIVYGFCFTSIVILMLVQIPSPLWFRLTGVTVLAPSAYAGWSVSKAILIRLKSIPATAAPTDESSEPEPHQG